ncbi:hypothetical protein ACFL2D_01365 [Patescibacteria group bacterium]
MILCRVRNKHHRFCFVVKLMGRQTQSEKENRMRKIVAVIMFAALTMLTVENAEARDDTITISETGYPCSNAAKYKAWTHSAQRAAVIQVRAELVNMVSMLVVTWQPSLDTHIVYTLSAGFLAEPYRLEKYMEVKYYNNPRKMAVATLTVPKKVLEEYLQNHVTAVKNFEVEVWSVR